MWIWFSVLLNSKNPRTSMISIFILNSKDLYMGILYPFFVQKNQFLFEDVWIKRATNCFKCITDHLEICLNICLAVLSALGTAKILGSFYWCFFWLSGPITKPRIIQYHNNVKITRPGLNSMLTKSSLYENKINGYNRLLWCSSIHTNKKLPINNKVAGSCNALPFISLCKQGWRAAAKSI